MSAAILVSILLQAAQLSDCMMTLYPFGEAAGDAQLPRGDGRFSPAISLSKPFRFYENNVTEFFINTNGLILFGILPSDGNNPLSIPLPSEQPPLLAPFWADVDTTSNGSIWYGDRSNDMTVIARAQREVGQYFPSQQDFIPTLVFISTWDQVPYFDSVNKTNTFQSVMISNGVRSFVIFQYSMIEWTTGDNSGGTNGLGGRQAEIGYDANDGVNFERVPLSGTAEVINITSTSNVGVDGVWAFALFNISATESVEEVPSVAIPIKSCDFTIL